MHIQKRSRKPQTNFLRFYGKILNNPYKMTSLLQPYHLRSIPQIVWDDYMRLMLHSFCQKKIRKKEKTRIIVKPIHCTRRSKSKKKKLINKNENFHIFLKPFNTSSFVIISIVCSNATGPFLLSKNSYTHTMQHYRSCATF